MLKRSNIFFWLFIAVFVYIFMYYSDWISKYLTADVFRSDANISGDIYYTDSTNNFDIYSNFESDSGNISFVMGWDDTKVKFDTSKIKSEYSADINNISDNMLKININKIQPFGLKNNLINIKYIWPSGYINISDAKIYYASWSFDALAITRINK